MELVDTWDLKSHSDCGVPVRFRPGVQQAGIAQLARALAFQAGGCGFESHCLLKNRLPDGERRSTGMNSTVGPGRVQSLFLFGGLAQLARALHLHCRGQRFESVILHNWSHS